MENGWGYSFEDKTTSASKDDSKENRRKNIPTYSPSNFLRYLVRFIVADDQSIRVVECPNFETSVWSFVMSSPVLTSPTAIR